MGFFVGIIINCSPDDPRHLFNRFLHSIIETEIFYLNKRHPNVKITVEDTNHPLYKIAYNNILYQIRTLFRLKTNKINNEDFGLPDPDEKIPYQDLWKTLLSYTNNYDIKKQCNIVKINEEKMKKKYDPVYFI